MSCLRYHRAPRGQSIVKPRKKTHVKKEWDNSVQDLNIHRPTREELVHRHEIHKSKNQWLAHWELQKKSLKKPSKKQNREPPERWAESRYDIMRKILQDEYNIKDVLEDSDRTLAVVKDLFGDAPRRRAGDPNVTLAPSCDLESSQGPIVWRKDPPTRLSILSQSIMDSQALNEMEQSFSHSEQSEDGQEASVNYQSKLHIKRDPKVLNGEPAMTKDLLWGKKRLVEEEFVTPCKAGDPLPHGQRALNATTAVKKVKSRLAVEEPQEQYESGSMFGHVLNTQQDTDKRCHVRGKKKHSAATELSSCNTSSLDILNQMTRDVELELAEYENQTGRDVTPVPKAQGLTGFTFSLVNSVRRLVFYLKESDRKLQQEVQERQCLQRELEEQRILIDALTADVISIKKGIMSDNSEMQQNLSTLKDPFGNITVTDPRPVSHLIRSEPVEENNLLAAPSIPAVDSIGELPKHNTTIAYQSLLQMKNPREGSAIPSHVFQQAVMLSPPRQQSRGQFTVHPSEKTVAQRNTVSGTNPNQDLPEFKHFPLTADHVSPPRAVTRVWTESQDRDRLVSVATSQEVSQTDHPAKEPQNRNLITEEESNRSCTELSDILGRMAELTQENSALKSHLKQVTKPMGKHDSPVGQTETASPLGPDTGSGTKAGMPGAVHTSLESRIAELNRQSAEAREKLLQLIDQQKQTSILSPEISPIPPQPSTGRRLEVSIPMPCLNDSSLEETPSPASRGSSRSIPNRSGSSHSSGAGKPQIAGHWSKAGREKGEGWFALTAHVC
ncbi:spindle and centriole-associated 1 isoform X1 [Pelobates cultripes]|uniref:Spindle and centriole-associated protein 1 n=1 Tax=Pelobates cultripes TaxID=61616 RepID=A0AAD1QX62_PELCU|nr:spindle and centriole-associated 1 isoform X1 [Pelobates cultripes]